HHGNKLDHNGNRWKQGKSYQGVCELLCIMAGLGEVGELGYVRELYKQDKTSREIAERTHMFFRDICAGHLEEKADYKPKSKSSHRDVFRRQNTY
ncbi:MAG: hypothetical protein M3Y53_11440, partial [Thermoproteota archaeon]|nr:hypothetical protein [Thermoproteota archaeon]